MPQAGVVASIARYPVKSMRGESLDSAELQWWGIPGDRGYAFVHEGKYNSFPWVTARDLPALLQHQPFWRPSTGTRPELVVRTPGGRELLIQDDELRTGLEAELGHSIRLHSDHRGNHDVAYVSFITTPTVARIATAAGVPVDARRFRMNFIIESEGQPFAENAWVGRELRIGDARFAVLEPDPRCTMITLDPESGASAPAVLKTAGSENSACAGVYASVVRTGTARVGDAVFID